MPNTDAEYSQGVGMYARAVDKGDAEMTSMGFPPAQRPTIGGQLADRPRLPERMSDLNMTQLVDLLNWYTSWYDYAINLMPNARSEKTTLESARDFAWAKIRREKALEKTVSDKDDATRIDVRYIKLNADLETADYKYNMLKAIAEGLLRDVESISRSITCQGHKFEAEGHRYTGERIATHNGSGPPHPGTNVLSRFRKRV